MLGAIGFLVVGIRRFRDLGLSVCYVRELLFNVFGELFNVFLGWSSRT